MNTGSPWTEAQSVVIISVIARLLLLSIFGSRSPSLDLRLSIFGSRSSALDLRPREGPSEIPCETRGSRQAAMTSATPSVTTPSATRCRALTPNAWLVKIARTPRTMATTARIRRIMAFRSFLDLPGLLTSHSPEGAGQTTPGPERGSVPSRWVQEGQRRVVIGDGPTWCRLGGGDDLAVGAERPPGPERARGCASILRCVRIASPRTGGCAAPRDGTGVEQHPPCGVARG